MPLTETDEIREAKAHMRERFNEIVQMRKRGEITAGQRNTWCDVVLDRYNTLRKGDRPVCRPPVPRSLGVPGSRVQQLRCAMGGE